MPPKKVAAAAADTASDDSTSLNDGEIKYLQAFLECLNGDIKDNVDWEAFQAKLGYKTVPAVKKKFRNMCQKFKWCEYAEGGAGAGIKKRGANTEGEAKPGKTKKAKKVAKETEEAEEAEEIGADEA
ncbi:hypothetical protein MN608_00990 [Microdochium nivale]|nr:hypothetical protein MN608_00990 [Microdochium nivale]